MEIRFVHYQMASAVISSFPRIPEKITVNAQLQGVSRLRKNMAAYILNSASKIQLKKSIPE